MLANKTAQAGFFSTFRPTTPAAEKPRRTNTRTPQDQREKIPAFQDLPKHPNTNKRTPARRDPDQTATRPTPQTRPGSNPGTPAPDRHQTKQTPAEPGQHPHRHNTTERPNINTNTPDNTSTRPQPRTPPPAPRAHAPQARRTCTRTTHPDTKRKPLQFQRLRQLVKIDSVVKILPFNNFLVLITNKVLTSSNSKTTKSNTV